MRIISLTAVLLAAPVFAQAEDFSGKFGWGGSFGGTGATGTKWVRDHSHPSWQGGGWVRYGFIPEFSLGASVEGLAFGDGNPSLRTVLLNGFYHISPDSDWNPNAHFGMGVANISANERHHGNAFTSKLGVGVDRFIHKQITVGAFLDYVFAMDQTRSTYPSHQVHAFLYGLNIGLWFGGEKPQTSLTPAPAKPAPQPAPRPAPSADEDKDGVLDDQDKCPGTPQGVKVNSMGCPKAKKVSIELLIEFDTAKAVVKTDYDQQLMKVSEFMKAFPDVKAEIEGHTDSGGKHAYNMDLSKRRAATVRKALIDRFGVPAERLTSKGYGPTKPVATNDTEEGRAKNRRVMATFSGMAE